MYFIETAPTAYGPWTRLPQGYPSIDKALSDAPLTRWVEIVGSEHYDGRPGQHIIALRTEHGTRTEWVQRYRVQRE